MNMTTTLASASTAAESTASATTSSTTTTTTTTMKSNEMLVVSFETLYLKKAPVSGPELSLSLNVPIPKDDDDDSSKIRFYPDITLLERAFALSAFNPNERCFTGFCVQNVKYLNRSFGYDKKQEYVMERKKAGMYLSFHYPSGVLTINKLIDGDTLKPLMWIADHSCYTIRLRGGHNAGKTKTQRQQQQPPPPLAAFASSPSASSFSQTTTSPQHQSDAEAEEEEEEEEQQQQEEEVRAAAANEQNKMPDDKFKQLWQSIGKNNNINKNATTTTTPTSLAFAPASLAASAPAAAAAPPLPPQPAPHHHHQQHQPPAAAAVVAPRPALKPAPAPAAAAPPSPQYVPSSPAYHPASIVPDFSDPATEANLLMHESVVVAAAASAAAISSSSSSTNDAEQQQELQEQQQPMEDYETRKSKNREPNLERIRNIVNDSVSRTLGDLMEWVESSGNTLDKSAWPKWFDAWFNTMLGPVAVKKRKRRPVTSLSSVDVTKFKEFGIYVRLVWTAAEFLCDNQAAYPSNKDDNSDPTKYMYLSPLFPPSTSAMRAELRVILFQIFSMASNMPYSRQLAMSHADAKTYNKLRVPKRKRDDPTQQQPPQEGPPLFTVFSNTMWLRLMFHSTRPINLLFQSYIKAFAKKYPSLVPPVVKKRRNSTSAASAKSAAAAATATAATSSTTAAAAHGDAEDDEADDDDEEDEDNDENDDEEQDEPSSNKQKHSSARDPPHHQHQQQQQQQKPIASINSNNKNTNTNRSSSPVPVRIPAPKNPATAAALAAASSTAARNQALYNHDEEDVVDDDDLHGMALRHMERVASVTEQDSHIADAAVAAAAAVPRYPTKLPHMVSTVTVRRREAEEEFRRQFDQIQDRGESALLIIRDRRIPEDDDDDNNNDGDHRYEGAALAVYSHSEHTNINVVMIGTVRRFQNMDDAEYDRVIVASRPIRYQV